MTIPGIKDPQNSRLGDVVGEAVWVGLLGEEAGCSGTEGSMTGSVFPLEHREVGLGVSKLGSEHWPGLVPTGGSVFMLKGRGCREGTCQFLCSLRDLWGNCLSAINSSLCALGALQIALSSCMFSGCLVAFSPSPNAR